MDRRQFVYAASAASVAATVSLGQSPIDQAPNDPTRNPPSPNDRLRVAVIGHTGRGNYGHGLDTVWLRLDQTEMVAVADPDEGGRRKAIGKLGLDAAAGFADYRQMLTKVRPEIVAVCPRHADQHCDMIVAAIEAGAKGVYVEKPFVRTPSEADTILALCAQHQAKVAVAHRNRYHPVLQTLDAIIEQGQIGRLLEIRGRGKGDRRGGAEDLWVLGSHVLNLMAYFAGNPKTCSAVMMQGGRHVTKSDVRDGAEGLGPLAGDELHARYEFDTGMIGFFDSIANDGTKNAGFGLQLIGSAGIIQIQADETPLAHLIPGNPFSPSAKPRPWLPISTAGVEQPEPRKDLDTLIHHHGLPATDLVEAVRGGGQPICNAAEGAETVEMICAVFESHRQAGRAIEFPLQQRDNALAML